MKTFTKFMLAASIGGVLQSAPVAACDGAPFIGEVCPVAFNFAPRGWATTSGQLLAINQNDALFSILGTVYGGDGRTTFGLPDTRSRVVIGAGQGPGLQDYRLGVKGGTEYVTLVVANMPSHSHVATTALTDVASSIDVAAQIHASSGNANQSAPGGNVLAVAPGTNTMYRNYDSSLPQVAMNAASVNYTLALPSSISASATTETTSAAGGSRKHSNMSPSLGLYWVIATLGTYPSRS